MNNSKKSYESKKKIKNILGLLIVGIFCGTDILIGLVTDGIVIFFKSMGL